MQTTDFADILAEAAEEVTALNPDDLDSAEFKAIRRSARRRLQTAWEYHFWPELGRVEQRFYKADWDIDTNYAAGSFVYYPPTQKYYQATTAAFGDAPATADGTTYVEAGWAEAETSYSASEYDATKTYVVGDRAQYGDFVYQLHVASATGVVPTDTGSWGVLVPFDRYVPYEQTGKTALGVINAAWNGNPRVTTRATELNWTLSENGVQIHSNINFAWLDFRLRCPVLTGNTFDSTATYASGDQIYFSSTATPGNFYTANTGTSAGESPDTAAAKWDVVQIPLIFHRYLVLAIAGDWVRGPGGGAPEDWGALLTLAQEALEYQKSLLVGQQGQRIKTLVQTR